MTARSCTDRGAAVALARALAASRHAVSPTAAEPACDLAAQLAALRDPAHPKHTLFVAAGDARAATLACAAARAGLHAAARPEGTLITRHEAIVDAFRRRPRLSDDDLARWLGYPEPKADAVAAGTVIVLQARDRAGAVVTEAVVARARLADVRRVLGAHVPPGGALVSLTPLAALRRRLALRQAERAGAPIDPTTTNPELP